MFFIGIEKEADLYPQNIGKSRLLETTNYLKYWSFPNFLTRFCPTSC